MPWSSLSRSAGGFQECSVALPLPGSKNPCNGRKASADSIVMYDKLQQQLQHHVLKEGKRILSWLLSKKFCVQWER